jgi:SAM-dependent methyltransferase
LGGQPEIAMHPSVLEFLKRALPGDVIPGKSILEVGSQNVNGSPRDVLPWKTASRYVGVDGGPGTDVDIVCDASDLVKRFGENAFDIVISTEMLEHAKEWQVAVTQMKRVLKPEGTLIITTRSPGFPYHAYPNDYWRFTKEDFRKIFSDMKPMDVCDDYSPTTPGVFLFAVKPYPFIELDISEIRVNPV